MSCNSEAQHRGSLPAGPSLACNSIWLLTSAACLVLVTDQLERHWERWVLMADPGNTSLEKLPILLSLLSLYSY